MANKEDGGPAFPRTVQSWNDRLQGMDGMSLRDYAVIEFLAAQIMWEGMEGSDVALNVAMAHEYVDAMLAERNKP